MEDHVERRRVRSPERRRKSPSPPHYRRDRRRSRTPSSDQRRKPSLSPPPAQLAEPVKIPRIMVSKLTRNVGRSHLNEIFGYFGEIKDVDIPVSKPYENHRGFAFIEYHKLESAEKAIELMNDVRNESNSFKFIYSLIIGSN